MVMYSCWLCSCFFFSSRRRHTRSTRDWSSDVCSSDLLLRALRHLRQHAFPLRRLGGIRLAEVPAASFRGAGAARARSEERRVGKSGDGGGGRMMIKKKGRSATQ